MKIYQGCFLFDKSDASKSACWRTLIGQVSNLTASLRPDGV
jgi:hypothetical protein